MLLAALVCGVAFARRSTPTPTPAPTPTPVADPAVTKLMRQQFVSLQAGTIHKELYAAGAQAKLTPALIDDLSHKLAALGPLTDMIFLGPFATSDIPADARGYIYQMVCHDGNVYLLTIIDGHGKIATIFFKDKLTTEDVEVPAGASPPAAPAAAPSP